MEGVEEKGAAMHFKYDGASTVEVTTKQFVADDKLVEVIALSAGSSTVEESPYKATVLKREKLRVEE